MNKPLAALSISAFILLGIFLFVTFIPSNPSIDNSRLQGDYVDIVPEELKSYLDEEKDIYLLDVHIPEQLHIDGTDDFIPFNEIENSLEKLPTDKETQIVVYCRSGSMSRTASETLIKLGYKNVKNLLGGANAWRAMGYE